MISASGRLSHQRFARNLLEAMGLGSMAGVASLVVACSGNVSVERGSGTTTGNGTGGDATTSAGAGGSVNETSTTTVGAGGGGSFACDVPVPEDNTRVYACLSGSQPTPCPSSDDPSVFTIIGLELDMGCGETVTQVLCGPDPNVEDESCCYYVAMENELCGGRPFTVAGHAQRAPAVPRGGFSAGLAPDVSRLDATTRAALAAAWGRDARDEHASIASFARFALELLAVGAPAALLDGAHRALGDEIRHAELCFGLASAYAGAPLGPGRLPMAGALEGRDDLATIAVAAVKEGCIGETLAALIAEAQRDAAEDPAVRGALDRIAADEAAHAALAWRFVAWAVAEQPAEVGSAVAAAFAEHVVTAGGAVEVGGDHAAMRAHGRLDASEVRAITAHAWAEVIRPCARAMLGGDRAGVC